MDVILVPIVAILCVFGVPVAIVWMILSHRRNRAAEMPPAGADSAELVGIAQRMEQRIDALEQILDSEASGWRKRHHE